MIETPLNPVGTTDQNDWQGHERNQRMTDASRENVDRLMANLGSKNAVERRDARAALVQIGSAAVSPLLDGLDASQPHVRWEAAKALAEIADPAAAQRLVAALGDKDGDVRWVVGAALIAMGRDAVKPLLIALAQSELSDGAHHVLHDLAKRGDLGSLLQPVLSAFDEPEPGIAVPLAAAESLKSIAE